MCYSKYTFPVLVAFIHNVSYENLVMLNLIRIRTIKRENSYLFVFVLINTVETVKNHKLMLTVVWLHGSTLDR